MGDSFIVAPDGSLRGRVARRRPSARGGIHPSASVASSRGDRRELHPYRRLRAPGDLAGGAYDRGSHLQRVRSRFQRCCGLAGRPLRGNASRPRRFTRACGAFTRSRTRPPGEHRASPLLGLRAVLGRLVPHRSYHLNLGDPVDRRAGLRVVRISAEVRRESAGAVPLAA